MNSTETNTVAAAENTAVEAAPMKPYRPIFRAIVTPGMIEDKVSTTGTRYALLTKARVVTRKSDQEITAMAFGKSYDDARPSLIPGQPIELACQWDEGSLKIIGLPREKAAPANDTGADIAAAA